MNINDFDYINIYQRDNGKFMVRIILEIIYIFSNDIECPINDIIIIKSTNSDNSNSFDGYQKIELKNNDIFILY